MLKFLVVQLVDYEELKIRDSTTKEIYKRKIKLNLSKDYNMEEH